METNDLKEQIEKCPFNGVYVLQSPHHQLDIHLLTNALKAFLDEHTALEQRVAQYETLLHAINVADFLDYENQIEHYSDGWMIQTEDGSQLSGPFDTALEAWNALKDHNK